MESRHASISIVVQREFITGQIKVHKPTEQGMITKKWKYICDWYDVHFPMGEVNLLIVGGLFIWIKEFYSIFFRTNQSWNTFAKVIQK